MSKIEQPINGHPILDPFTWLVNVIVQPRTGEGSSPANGEHFQANLDEIRSKLVERIDVANRLDVTESNKVLDARQGKVLADQIAAILAQKAAANGIATLGADGKIPSAQVPSIALVDVFPVASEAEMLALTAEQGDMAIRTDTSQVFILSASPATTIENWIELSALKALVDAAVADLAGTGRTTETVKGNYDSINIINSKYFSPSAVMGFEGRNLMDVFGTSTVADTSQALRTYCNQNGPNNTHIDGFRKLRLGDYIDLPSLTMSADSVNPLVYPARTINNNYNRLRVEIVGFDNYYQVGNTAVPSQHHVTMMFKDIPTTAPFNKTNTTTGDYPASMLFHWLHERFEPALISAINGGGATVVEPLAVDRNIGTVANWAWVGSEKIFLPTNVNIFGTTGFSHTNYGTGTQTQFALFALNPNRKIKRNNNSRSYWWLAEPSANSSVHFCTASYRGYSTYDNAGITRGVVPAFLI